MNHRAYRNELFSFGRLASFVVLLALLCLPVGLAAQDMSANGQGGEEQQTDLTTTGGVVFHTTDNPVEQLRTVSVPGSAVELYLWNEVLPSGQTQAYYAFSPDGHQLMGRVRATTYNVGLRDFTFDPMVQKMGVEAVLAARPDNTLYLVQFEATPLPELQAPITQSGGKIHRFLTDHTFIVEMSLATRNAVANLPIVRWVGPYHPAYRTEEYLRDALTGKTSPLEEQRYSIMVNDRDHSQQESLAEAIRNLGGFVHFTTPSGFRMEADLTQDQLLEVLHNNAVQFIDRWGGPGELDMNIVRDLGGANYLESMTGWTGQGVRGEIFDTELLTYHQEWLYSPIIHSSSSSGGYHGTACFGINFARGVDPNARGLLPDGQGIFYLYSESNQFGGSKSRYDICAELIDPLGPYRAVFQTASVGSTRTTQYTTISAEVDDYLFLHQILSTQSQSNAGNQDSRPQAWAKNMVGVGGFYHYNTSSRTDDRWNYSGSIGPAQDGRIKPDLAYFYDSIHTTYGSGSSSYTEFGGTSAATPTTSGHFGLLFQMWHEELWPGHGGGSSVFNSRPHTSTAKALLFNTAYRYDWTSGGPNADINRYVQGWGTADVRKLYDRADKTMVIDESDVILPLETKTYVVSVPVGETELNVTMVYTDLMGTVGASQHRINDLSLKVTSPSSTVYWGNNGLTSSNFSSSGGVSNTRDTVENVFIQNPAAGNWTVQVIGDEIIQDSHPETGNLDADFALVISGIEGGASPFELSISPDPLVSNQNNTFSVTGGDPYTNTYLAYSTLGSGSTWVSFLNVYLDIRNPTQGGTTKVTDGNGDVSWDIMVPPHFAGRQVWIQAAQYGQTTNVVYSMIQ